MPVTGPSRLFAANSILSALRGDRKKEFPADPSIY
jgi:hypothetical protein